MVRMRRVKQNEQEKNVADQYNRKDVMRGYKRLNAYDDVEFSAENEGNVNVNNQDALEATHTQVIDAYNAGTIDQGNNERNDERNNKEQQ